MLDPTRVARRVIQAIPEGVKAPLRDSSAFRNLRTPWHARRLARSTKRLDLCAAQFAQSLHLAGDVRLEGARCLELGAGWVLTHALVCHLLGAERIVAVDVEPVARPEAVREAVAAASPALIRDVLAPFSEHSRVRARLDRLRAIRRFDAGALAQLGIEYRAPTDLSRCALQERFDLVYSFSVLEHVPLSDVAPLLQNLATLLRPDGAMLHAIHLEDHLDLAGAPFAFLGRRVAPFSTAEAADRGNRLRAGTWLQAFAALESFQTRVLWRWQRTDAVLPAELDPLVTFADEADLRTSHLGVLVRAPRAPAPLTRDDT